MNNMWFTDVTNAPSNTQPTTWSSITERLFANTGSISVLFPNKTYKKRQTSTHDATMCTDGITDNYALPESQHGS